MSVISLRKSKQKKEKKIMHESDGLLLGIIFMIILFGLAMLSSASAPIAYLRFKNTYHYFYHQLFGIITSFLAFFFFLKTDYHIWRKHAFWFLIGSIFLLTLVFIPGLRAEHGSARSWINVFGYSLQPSELVKISFLLYLSAWLENRGKRLHDFYDGTGPFLIILGIIALLMLLQPDMGTLFIIAITSMIVYFVGGGSWRHIIAIGLFGVMAFSIMIYARPYQMNRIRCLIDPGFSRDDVCYQINQSLIAVGSGGFWGRGIGESRQKFMYVPEVVGDSIFAIISEEIGFVFSVLLLLLFLSLFYRGFLIAKYAPDVYGRVLAIGISSWILIQVVINIGGIINIMPMTGVPLPLISNGGSAMLASLSALGILANISKQTK